ncbi:hypothetical protein [uncultured Sphaerochaeta sp.]|uniref:hypothetical protein n=1 Tax=uncultured Sphaerochaeta sp. TaxID=886478 RepID=UPI002A0A21E8|nr:hypothetical protein [uncultured Sphaerochaeta sp.]
MRRHSSLILLICCFSLVLFGCKSTEQLPQGKMQKQPNNQTGTPPMGPPPDSIKPMEPPPERGKMMTPPSMSSQTEINGTAKVTYTTDQTLANMTYTSMTQDENALLVENGAKVSMTNATVTKSKEATSNTENSDFYGQNAAILVRDGSTLSLSGSTVSSSAQGGNAIFAYGKDSHIDIKNTKISTTANNSGGLDCAGGASISGSGLTIATAGQSAASIRSDRGGGILSLEGGTYMTSGTGSPAIYSTADITVKNAILNAKTSEAVVIEGKNSATLENCDVTGSMVSNEHVQTILLYQSMSGDAEVGHSTFTMTGGFLTGKTGDLFYVTNTTSSINLENVKLSLANGVLLTVSGNDSPRGWGKSGANGGTCTLTAKTQVLAGTISCDAISSLDISLTNNSSFVGQITNEGTTNVTLDGTSTWTLTGDSTISSIKGNKAQINTNGYKLTIK